MQGQSIRDSERVGNVVMLAYICGIAVAGWGAVMLMLNGGLRECVFLIGGLCGIITKIFEKNWEVLQSMYMPVFHQS